MIELRPYTGPHAGNLHHVVESDTGRVIRNASELEVQLWQELETLKRQPLTPPPAVSIAWYDSPEAVHRAMWEPIALEEGMSYDDLLQCEVVGQLEDGEHVTLTYQDEIAGMKAAGTWGWVDFDRHAIHAWAAADADPARILHMLAHEIGHITGERHPDELQEEMRAEQFGHVARLAYELLQQRVSARLPLRDAFLAGADWGHARDNLDPGAMQAANHYAEGVNKELDHAAM